MKLGINSRGSIYVDLFSLRSVLVAVHLFSLQCIFFRCGASFFVAVHLFSLRFYRYCFGCFLIFFDFGFIGGQSGSCFFGCGYGGSK